ncbi:alpha,alpha-trehalase, partial [Ostertagia ostertagi]
ATLRNFDELGDKAKDIAVLREFVNSHFNPPGSELVEWFPRDWVDFPSTFLNIHGLPPPKHGQPPSFTSNLERFMPVILRNFLLQFVRVRDDVRRHQDHYSLLYVPHPFIIPGGRFREFYYWDSFWILKGLIFSEMYETARGIIKNLAFMVDKGGIKSEIFYTNGFVPNGGRVYYLTRSQPPLLIPMVYDYFLGTGDLDFVLEVLPTLEKEYLFWIKQRSRIYKDENGTEKFPYYQYRATLKVPRPESYREDYEMVHHLKRDDIEEKTRMWSEIASAAETGWDFSTRWFAQDGEDKHAMRSIRTWSIVPVDLNAFMCVNARILASLFEIRGDFKKVAFYQQRYELAKREMKEIHWNETDGIWYDYDLEKKTHSNIYYVSNAVPLYAKCYDDEDDVTPHRVHQYLKSAGVMNFTKGLPTSLAMGSEQQWDKENAWPPMVHMVAEKMATSWLSVTYQAFIRTHAMFEKYNVTTLTEEMSAGGGGEYEVQTGFGWTNGVILDLLDKYGDKMKGSSSISPLAALCVLAVVLYLD